MSSRSVGSSPSPSDGDACRDIRSVAVRDGSSEVVEHHYDWATFISAYAAGRWDPHHTPNPPCSHLTHFSCSRTVPSTTADSDSYAWTLLAAHEAAESKGAGTPSVSHEVSKLSNISSASVLSRIQSSPESLQIAGSGEGNLSLARPTFKANHSRMPLILPQTTHHSLRNSLPDWRASASKTSSNSFTNSAQPSNPNLTTTAATLRWAAAGVNLAPLAIPSPEHELTDPMRGVTATIPGSHVEARQVMEPMTPGGTRRSRLGSFWHGTQDIEDIRCGRLATIDSSPSEISEDTDTKSSVQLAMPFPASAPLVRINDKPSDDYFGGLDRASEDTNICLREGPPIVRRSSTPLDAGTVSVPAVPRRVCLTRQTSSPLPITAGLERYSASRVALHNNEPFTVSRAAKEEQMYAELGYLVPPNPPDEWERRRALNKWETIICSTPSLLPAYYGATADLIFGPQAPISILTV
jgi:hypothetical protein